MRKFINIINESQTDYLEKLDSMSDDMQEQTPEEEVAPPVDAPVEPIERRGRAKKRPIPPLVK